MAKKTLNIGTTANDGQGDTLRDAAGKINDNFTELFAAAFDSAGGGSGYLTPENINTLSELNAILATGGSDVLVDSATIQARIDAGGTSSGSMSVENEGISSLDSADVLTGSELVPAVQTGTGVATTSRDLIGNAAQQLVGFDAQRVSVCSLLVNCPDGFVASSGDLYGIEPLLCIMTSSGGVAKSGAANFQYGVAELSTGNTNSGYAAVRTSMGVFLFAAGISEMSMGFSMAPRQLSTGSDRSLVRAGWQRISGGGTYDQCIAFEHNHTDANWMAVVQGTGAAEKVDTGVPVTDWTGALDAMLDFKVVYKGSTEEAMFYINGLLEATIDCSTHTINALTDVAVSIQKSEDTTNHRLLCDTILLDTVLDSQIGNLI